VPEERDSGITVEVYGNSFTFKKILNPAQLHAAAAHVESRMKELSEKCRVVGTLQLAIMAALEMSIELAELSENAERGRRVAKSILESLDRNLPHQAEDAREDSEPFFLG
jgi:cell division protein ZapA (FtsZ GTPase activity inhibitor)